MAKILSGNAYLMLKFRNPCVSSKHVTTTNVRKAVIPSALRITEKPTDSEMLRNLRIAVTPTYGYGLNTYETGKINTGSSSLAGDPKRLQPCQNIRAEILEKWNMRPQPDVQREWLKNIMFN